MFSVFTANLIGPAGNTIAVERMKKYHVHTTLSPKHREILDKYKGQYVTYERVLEHALECLEKDSANPYATGQEEQAPFGDRSGMFRMTLKEVMNIFIETADVNLFKAYVAEKKPAESMVEYYCQKPFNECSLKEIVDILVAISRHAYWFDKVIDEEDDDFYTVNIYHSSGLNNSKIFQVIFGSLFEACGASAEIKISNRSLFIKVNKKMP